VPEKTGARVIYDGPEHYSGDCAGEDFGGRGSIGTDSARSAASTPVLPLKEISCILPEGFGAII
jgi:hypothetical protein